MTPEELAALKVHVGAAAWARHEALTDKVDVNAALIVLRDVRLVAAAVLDDLAERASKVDKLKIGAISLDLASRGAEYAVRARALREEFAQAARSSSRRSSSSPVVPGF